MQLEQQLQQLIHWQMLVKDRQGVFYVLIEQLFHLVEVLKGVHLSYGDEHQIFLA